MRIFVTGGTGFLGKRLVQKLLSDGHTLLLFVRSEKELPVWHPRSKSQFSLLRGDVVRINRVAGKIKKFRPDAAIHLAWEGIPKSDPRFNKRNLQGSLRTIKALAMAGCKTMVVAGSCHEYGEPGKKVNERSPLHPYNALYATKVFLYEKGAKIAAKYGMRFIWTRLGFIYGPGQRRASLIPYLLDSIRKGESPMLKNPKGGNDFIYVDDVARAFAQILNKKHLGMNKIYNVGSGRLSGIFEVVQKVYQSLGLAVPKSVKRVSKPHGFFMDISKIKKEIGWKPRTSLKAGIRATIENNESIHHRLGKFRRKRARQTMPRERH